MQIIVMHPRFASAKSVTLRTWHLWMLALGLVAMAAAMACGLYFLTMRYADTLPFVRNGASMVGQDDASKKDKYLRENLAVMAVKLGEMQAQLVRLDALGERVQGLSGVKPEEFNFKERPGRGGAEAAGSHAGAPLTLSQFQQALDALASDVERRYDYMNVVETALMTDKIKSKLLPTILPVNVSYNASSFGWRLDPFTGNHAFHEGVDFASPNGTPIVAAAGGVVIVAEYHSQFGNTVQIDHGNDIVTRYAHASRLYVKTGDIVTRGQHIADIGSTGRSTGSHLHFEVLVKGVPQNPHKFLSAGADQARIAGLGRNK